LSTPLEDAIQNATERPSAESIHHFYTTFLETEVIVPCKMQARPVKNLSPFPAPFSNILAVTAQEQEIIPAFTTQEQLQFWAQEPLEWISMTGETLCQRAPETMWISINPSGEWGKELSAWEISLLAQGTEGLQELVAEQLQHTDPHITFQALSEEQAERIVSATGPALKEYPTIQAVFAGTQVSESAQESYLIGALITNEQEQEHIRKSLQERIQGALIGDNPFSLTLGTTLDASPELALFKFSDPLIQNQDGSSAQRTSLMKKLGQWIKARR
jgi:hypothetical protein